MKINKIFTGFLATALMALCSCAEVDQLTFNDGVGVQQLVVQGHFYGESVYYGSTIDTEAGTIVVQVPYYISDTEEIQGDLTQMQLEATMPSGYRFSPSLQGIHDLTQPYSVSLIDPYGNQQQFQITAAYYKSTAAQILTATLVESTRTTVSVKEPENEGDHGQIIVLKTTSSVDAATHAVKFTISPWATIESEAMDPETGYVDFTKTSSVTIVAQDGVTKVTYDMSMQYPELVDAGSVGYISNLFGYQIYTDNEQGFEAGKNHTIAAVDDYLIVSNIDDVNSMLVLDRYSGEKVNVKVNTTGMPTDRIFRAICNDDEGHLLAASFTSTSRMVTDPTVYIYAWKDGITSAPTKILQEDMSGDYFSALSMTTWPKRDLFYKLDCRGNIFSGDAVISFTPHLTYRVVMLPFLDGKTNGNAQVEYAGGIVSMWYTSNASMTTATAPYGYVWHTGNFRATVVYCPQGTGSRAFNFTTPSSHWWSGNVWGVSYREFNGCKLLAVACGSTSSALTTAERLYVTDLGSSPTASSLGDGFIFDSREGNKSGTSGIQGSGYAVTGMTSAYSFATGKTVLGSNEDGMACVCFGKSDDGNAVQVYLFVPDQGLIGYEITRFNIQ